MKICLNVTHLHFCGNNYQQIFGTAVGSPVSAVIANMVMEDVETRALNAFISGPKLWKRYIDDIFVLLKQNKLTDLFNHINAVENSINFTMEKEKNDSVAFLDTTTGAWPETNTCIFAQSILLHINAQHWTLTTLLQRADKLCDQENERKEEIDLVRSTLNKTVSQTALSKETCKQNKERKTWKKRVSHATLSPVTHW